MTHLLTPTEAEQLGKVKLKLADWALKNLSHNQFNGHPNHEEHNLALLNSIMEVFAHERLKIEAAHAPSEEELRIIGAARQLLDGNEVYAEKSVRLGRCEMKLLAFKNSDPNTK